MFEVLAFVYENFYAEDSCPEPAHLQRKLSGVGFDPEEIADALDWLTGLGNAARFAKPAVAAIPTVLPAAGFHFPVADSMRIYSAREQNHLKPECIGYLHFLDHAGITPAHRSGCARPMSQAASPPVEWPERKTRSVSIENRRQASRSELSTAACSRAE